MAHTAPERPLPREKRIAFSKYRWEKGHMFQDFKPLVTDDPWTRMFVVEACCPYCIKQISWHKPFEFFTDPENYLECGCGAKVVNRVDLEWNKFDPANLLKIGSPTSKELKLAKAIIQRVNNKIVKMKQAYIKKKRLKKLGPLAKEFKFKLTEMLDWTPSASNPTVRLEQANIDLIKRTGSFRTDQEMQDWFSEQTGLENFTIKELSED